MFLFGWSEEVTGPARISRNARATPTVIPDLDVTKCHEIEQTDSESAT